MRTGVLRSLSRNIQKLVVIVKVKLPMKYVYIPAFFYTDTVLRE